MNCFWTKVAEIHSFNGKGNPSFRVHYSIIKNYFLNNLNIIGKLMFSSFIWHHKHDQWITHDRLRTIWSGTVRNPIVQNNWMAATLGSVSVCGNTMCYLNYRSDRLFHPEVSPHITSLNIWPSSYTRSWVRRPTMYPIQQGLSTP